MSATLVMALAVAAPLRVHSADEYPQRSVRFIVPYTPGAINDFVARLTAQKLTDAWGRQVVVDNRPGGGTLIGTDLVAKANPDGYTMLLVPTAFAINVSLYPKLPYDPLRDFAPVTQIGSGPYLMVCTPQLPVKNIKELVALAKAKPGTLSYASTGSGGSAHLMGELLESQGVEIVASTPDQFAKFIREEIVRWGRAVKLSGAKPD